jgi:hypothetical protein
LIQAQKELLLKSADIASDVRNLLDDPTLLEKLNSTRKPEANNKSKPSDKKFPQDSKKEEEKQVKDDVYFDYKTTSFFKKLGAPRTCTLFQVN